MRKMGPKVVFLMLFASFGTIYAQLDALDECFNDDFVDELTGCFFTKFDDLLGGIELSSYEAQSANTGRKLMFAHMDDALRKNSMPKVLDHLLEKQKAFAEPLLHAAQMLRKGASHDTVKTALKGHNLKRLHDNYIRGLAARLAPFAKNVGVIKHAVNEYISLLKDTNPALQKDDPVPLEPFCDDFLEAILGEELCNLLNMFGCLESYEEESFEDSLDWLQCLFQCGDIPQLSMCVLDLFNQTEACASEDWLANIILRGFLDMANLGDCFFDIEETDDPIILKEGTEPAYVSFKTYMPPGVQCMEPNMLDNPLMMILDILLSLLGLGGDECQIQVQMSTSMWMYDVLPYIDIDLSPIFPPIKIGRPKCRSDAVLEQAVIGWYEHASNYSCTINITDENWNSTFRVPVAASVDNKDDGDHSINFTMKLTKDGETIHTTKLPVTVEDTDASRTSTCQSVNDPHILTFDGHLYNNFYQGYFQLYKHNSLPYEVQVIYQACSETTEESCTCAVAVRSGDDVVVLDRCRTYEACPGPECNLLKLVIFANGELTPGTRVVVREGGQRYDIVLPHGTVIRVITSEDLLNVWIVPSTYDKGGHTKGLCGVFNEDKSDDLTLPDDTIYTGPGDEIQGQPRNFSQAWRVPEESRIFRGVEADSSFEPLEYCKCHHILMEGVRCICGHDHLAEYCDMDLEGELDEEHMQAITRRSQYGVADTDEDRIIDESYEPDEVEWHPDADWNEQSAKEFCNNLIINSENEVIKACRSDYNLPSEDSPSVMNCVEDIKITDSDVWALSALENAKQECMDTFNRLITVTADEFKALENSTCGNECNLNGDCVFGVCECHSGFTGGDCSVVESSTPEMVMVESSVCDNRHESCHYATVYGKNFRESEDFKCTIQEFDVSAGRIQSSHRKDVNVIFINKNQIACKLPESGSYEISLTYRGNRIAPPLNSGSFVFMSHDSACFECNLGTNQCTRKSSNDHCYIDDGCYEPDEESPRDECSVCNITHSTSEWTDRPTQVCIDKRAEEEKEREDSRRDLRLRAGIAAGISAFIIIVTIIFFIIDRKKNKGKVTKVDLTEMNADHQTASSSKEPVPNGYEAPIMVQTSKDEPEEVLGHENPVMEHTDVYEDVTVTSFSGRPPSPVSAPAVSRIKGEAGDSHSIGSNRSEKLAKDGRSSSVGSIRSIGIGAAGPTHYAHIHKEDENYGIGGRGGYTTPTGKRKDFQGVHTVLP